MSLFSNANSAFILFPFIKLLKDYCLSCFPPYLRFQSEIEHFQCLSYIFLMFAFLEINSIVNPYLINLANLNQTLEIYQLSSRSERNKEEIGLNDFSDFQILREVCLRSRGSQKGGTDGVLEMINLTTAVITKIVLGC